MGNATRCRGGYLYIEKADGDLENAHRVVANHGWKQVKINQVTREHEVMIRCTIFNLLCVKYQTALLARWLLGRVFWTVIRSMCVSLHQHGRGLRSALDCRSCSSRYFFPLSFASRLVLSTSSAWDVFPSPMNLSHLRASTS